MNIDTKVPIANFIAADELATILDPVSNLAHCYLQVRSELAKSEADRNTLRKHADAMAHVPTEYWYGTINGHEAEDALDKLCEFVEHYRADFPDEE